MVMREIQALKDQQAKLEQENAELRAQIADKTADNAGDKASK
jgi:chaperonin cofactor prefoldin